MSHSAPLANDQDPNEGGATVCLRIADDEWDSHVFASLISNAITRQLEGRFRFSTISPIPDQPGWFGVEGVHDTEASDDAVFEVAYLCPIKVAIIELKHLQYENGVFFNRYAQGYALDIPGAAWQHSLSRWTICDSNNSLRFYLGLAFPKAA